MVVCQKAARQQGRRDPGFLHRVLVALSKNSIRRTRYGTGRASDRVFPLRLPACWRKRFCTKLLLRRMIISLWAKTVLVLLALPNGWASDTDCLYRRFKLWFARSNFLIGPGRVHIVSKTAGRIIAVLLHHKFPREKRHRYLAALRVLRNKGRDVAFDSRFAER